MAENVPIYIQLETGEAEKNIGNVKKAIKELTQVALENGDAQSEAYQKAIQKAGELSDSIQDVKDGISTFKGDPIENLSKGFGTLKGKLLDLDFKGFSEEVGRLNKVSKQVTFKELAGSVGETAKAFGNLGKILLTNPIFILTTVIALIVSNFDKLKESGGFIGEMFSAIGDTINFVIDKLKMLSDWLGLTDFQGQEKANNTLKNAEKEQEAIEQRYDAEIKIAEAAGKDTKKLELEKQEALRNSIKLQLEQLEYLKKSQGKLTEDQQKQYDELNKSFKDSLTETAVINAQAQKEADDKAAKDEEERRKKREERSNQIKKEQGEVTTFLASEEEKRLQDKLSAEDKELRQAELKYLELRKKANGNSEILLKLEEDYRIKKETITKKYDDIEKENIKKQEFEKNKIRLESQENEFNARLEAFGTEEEREIQAVNEKYDRLFETLNLNSEEEKALLKKQQKDVADISKKYRDEEEKATKEANQKALDDADDAFRDKVGLIQFYIDAVFSVANSINDIFATISEARIAKLESETDAELSELDRRQQNELNNKNLTEEQKKQIENKYALQKFELEKKLVIARNKIAEKVFKTTKALNLANAITSGAAAVVNALSTPPFTPASIVSAIAVGAASAANIAKILATKFTPEGLPATPNLADVNVGGGGGSFGTTAPAFNPPQFFGIGNGTLQGSPSGGGTQQVVVLENDITQVQNRVRVIENRATIG